jgi:hypothetical protein
VVLALAGDRGGALGVYSSAAAAITTSKAIMAQKMRMAKGITSGTDQAQR